VASVAIVGAGIAGLCLAVELRNRGAAVTVIERRYPGAGDSGRNVGRMRRTQLTADLTEFACAASDRWEQLDRLMGGRNPLLYPTSYSWALYRDEERARIESLRDAWKAHGARARMVSSGELLEQNPILIGGEPPRSGVITDGVIVHHDAAIHGLYLEARSRGVQFLVNDPVVDAVSDGDRLVGVITGAGKRVDADVVVNAAGSRSADVARMLGVEIPNRAVRREVLVTEPKRPFMRGAVVFYTPQEGWFNQTLRGELVAGVVDSDEPLGFNEGSSFRFLARTARVMTAKAPRLASLRVIRQWAGCYDWTPDKRPIVGFHAARPGLYELNGWSGRGFHLGPLTARLASREILGDGRDPLLRAFVADRFVGSDAVVSPTADYFGSYR
jgi:sarcosine oxidase, subunit beta